MSTTWLRTAALTCAVVGLFALLATAAQARLVHPSTTYTLDSAHRYPYSIKPGPDGALWFAEGQSNSIGRITTSGAASYFPIPFPDPSPDPFAGPLTVGADGNIWFASRTANVIGRLTPGGTFTSFPVPTSNSGLADVETGSDGNVWFSEQTANKIGKITPAGAITEYSVPLDNANPRSLTLGGDGNIWFTEDQNFNSTVIFPPPDRTSGVAKVTPSGGFTEYPVTPPSGGSIMTGLTTAPNGDVVAAGRGADPFNIGDVIIALHQFTPSGSLTTSTVDRSSEPDEDYYYFFGIGSPWFGPNGKLWFNGNQESSDVYQWSPGARVARTPYAFPAGVYAIAADITTGPDGNVWVAYLDADNGAITKISPTAVEVPDDVLGGGASGGGGPVVATASTRPAVSTSSNQRESKGRVTLGAVSCPSACTVRATAKAKLTKKGKAKAVGSGSLSLTAGKSGKPVVKLSAAARRALKKARKLRLTVTVVVTPGGGASVSRTYTVTVKAAKTAK